MDPQEILAHLQEASEALRAQGIQLDIYDQTLIQAVLPKEMWDLVPAKEQVVETFPSKEFMPDNFSSGETQGTLQQIAPEALRQGTVFSPTLSRRI